MDLGQQIKVRRKELGLSLRQLAERSDLTASFLSQIERGLTSPSIDSLRKISEALGVPIFYFLLQVNVPSPVVRKNERRHLALPNAEHITYQLLTPDSRGNMGVVMVELMPGDGGVPLTHHSYTEECIFVIEGELEVGIGSQIYHVYEGDTVYFAGATLHYLSAVGNCKSRFISISTPPIF